MALLYICKSRTMIYMLSSLLVILLVQMPIPSHTLNEDTKCLTLKQIWDSKGWPKNQLLLVPTQSVSGAHLKVCSPHNGTTCCTSNMERELSSQGKSDVEQILQEKIKQLKDSFDSRITQYHKFCTELIEKAAVDLHQMFLKTYGNIYETNAKIFTELFDDLKAYHTGRELDLEDVLDRFFTTLMQRMFSLINAQYNIDDRYLQCVVEHMDELQPFGDVPKKLTTQVKRAFVAARTFYVGLTRGRDVLNSIARMPLTSQCHSAFTRTEYCAYCRGLISVRPCDGLCMNTVRGCLAYHSQLHDTWTSYIDSLLKVAERLEGPFNIESVVDPMNVKISDAIMNFQETAVAVSAKIFQGCGQPTLAGRNKRTHSRSSDVSRSGVTFEWTPRDHPLPPEDSRASRYPPNTAAGTSISRLIPDIKERLGVARDFWRDLPHTICSGLSAPPNRLPDTISSCWNGTDVASYGHTVVSDGLLNQAGNPEVEVDIRHNSPVIQTEIYNLDMITGKLKSAHGGINVDWSDHADDGDISVGSSGSGEWEKFPEGSGSGMGPDDIERPGPSPGWGFELPEEPITRRTPHHEVPPARTIPPQKNMGQGDDKNVSVDGSRSAVYSLFVILFALVIQRFVIH